MFKELCTTNVGRLYAGVAKTTSMPIKHSQACNINSRPSSHLHKFAEPGAGAALALAFNNLRRRRLLHALEGSHASQTLRLPPMERFQEGLEPWLFWLDLLLLPLLLQKISIIA